MKLEQRIKSLEERVEQLEFDKSILENLLVSKVPEWALEPLQKVQSKGEIPYPFIKHQAYGSLDYYRIIALLVKNNII